ncbi:MAG TPA: hypothetical protein VHR45_00040 [Thermoanaerobaculia bacterium]|nr:hypothetical protein [Thermoanaerobaculia bacterium]
MSRPHLTALIPLLITLAGASALVAKPRPLTALEAPAAQDAAPPAGARSGFWGLLARFWSDTLGIFDGPGADRALAIRKEGCVIDPNGRCIDGRAAVAPPRAKSNGGCIIDPNGCPP